jgi:hypothetical protein
MRLQRAFVQDGRDRLLKTRRLGVERTTTLKMLAILGRLLLVRVSPSDPFPFEWPHHRQSLTLTGVGIGLGVAGAAAATRSLRGLLFGLTPLDAATFIGVAALFAIVATLAALLPAHRATRVEPLVALRNE